MMCALLVLSTLVMSFATDSSIKNWEFISNEKYKVTKINNTDKIMTREMQDTDYEEIGNAVKDKSRKKLDLNNLTEVKSNEFAFHTDNVLSDGSFLKEDYIKIKDKLIKEKTQSHIHDGNKNNDKLFKINVTGQEYIEMKQIKTSKGHVVIPENPNASKIKFEFSKDFKNTYIYDSKGVWSINSDTKVARQISKMNEKEYKKLVEQSLKSHGSNYLITYDVVQSNHSNTKLFFVSNKNNLDSGISDIFIIDLATDEETCLTEKLADNYYPIEWIDDSSILCNKFNKEGVTLVLINLKGQEYELKTSTTTPFVYSVKDNLIAYLDYLGSDTIRLAQISDNKLVELDKITVPGRTRVRAGFNGFSDDKSQLMALYIDPKNDNKSYVYVYNLSSKSTLDIRNLPRGGDFIEECSWFDDDSIFVTVGKKNTNNINVSSWLYNLK